MVRIYAATADLFRKALATKTVGLLDLCCAVISGHMVPP